MAKVDDLPNDVLRLILGNQLKKLNIIGNCRNLWKNTLPILAVCRRWRHIAQDMVYAHAIIEIDENQQTLSQPLGFENYYVALSNVELIEKNSMEHTVRRLYICFAEISEQLSILLPAAEALVIDIDECPELVNIRKSLNSGFWNHYFYNSDITEYTGVAKEIVDSICRRYPNVHWLELDMQHCENSCIAYFPDMLINAYAEQLMHIRCYSHDYFPCLNSASQLRTSRIEADTLDELDIVSLKPAMLEHLWLECYVYKFTWNDLRHDRSADVVRFGQLKSLVIKNMCLGTQMHNTNFGFRFEFLQLSILVLKNVRITPEIADCLMHAPLKQLDFTGFPTDALHLCSRNTGSLEKLFLSVDFRYQELRCNESIPPASALFDHIHNIRDIQCTINVTICYLDISNADFSNFTHLELDADIDLSQFVSKLPTMQKMTKLILRLQGFDDEQMAKTNAAILQLMMVHKMPILKNIREARISLPYTGQSRGFLYFNLCLMIPQLQIS